VRYTLPESGVCKLSWRADPKAVIETGDGTLRPNLYSSTVTSSHVLRTSFVARQTV
jgi:hypothetical protein